MTTAEVAILKRTELQAAAVQKFGKAAAAWTPKATNEDLRAYSTDWVEPTFDYRPQRELPAGWSFVALGNLGEWSSGGTPSKARREYWTNGTMPWVTARDMKVSLIHSSEDLVAAQAVADGTVRTVPPGTLLFVVRGMILAHTFPVALAATQVAFNQDLRAVTLYPGLVRGWRRRPGPMRGIL